MPFCVQAATGADPKGKGHANDGDGSGDPTEAPEWWTEQLQAAPGQVRILQSSDKRGQRRRGGGSE